MLRASRELACLRLEERSTRETNEKRRERRRGHELKGRRETTGGDDGRREKTGETTRWRKKREEEVEEGEEEEEEEIEYIRGVAARKVKRLSADDKTASRRPAASKGARGLARTVIEY